MLKKQRPYYLLITFLILLFASNCSGNIENSTPTLIESEPTSTQTIVEATETIEIEPTQESKNLFILLQDSQNYLNPGDLDLISARASELGYEVTTSEEIPENSNGQTTILIFTQDNEVLSYLSGITQERLIIVGEDTLDATIENSIFIQTSKANQISIAGYLAALITDDWRVGGLLPDEQFNNTAASTVFRNGVLFLCGRCTPVYGPIVNFPVTATLSSPEDTERTMQALGEISSNRLNSVFIPGAYLYDDLVILLRQNEVTIFSDINLESENSDWVDYSVTNNLSEIIIEILAEDDDQATLNDAISVEYFIQSYSNEIPLGRANFLQEMIDNLQSGLISPYEISSD
jgi:hypothetical protein